MCRRKKKELIERKIKEINKHIGKRIKENSIKMLETYLIYPLQ
jgi:hypothetical protein